MSNHNRKTNRFLLLVLLITAAFLSAGASSWLIISENSSSPLAGILKIVPVLTISNASTYEGEEIPTLSTAVAKDEEGNVIDGTFSAVRMPTSTKARNTTESETVQAQIKFTPTDTSKYTTATKTIYVTLHAVATRGSYYYMTVKKAIDDTSSGSNEVNIIPNLYKTPGVSTSGRFSPKLLQNAEVKSGVTLLLKHGKESSYDKPGYGVEKDGNRNYYHRQGTAGSDFADSTAAKVNSNLKNELTINPGVTLTVNGTLIVGGVLGETKQGLSGQTSGVYSQITMAKNAKIVANNAIIDILGYIKESSSNNGSSVTINSGTLYMPFVIYDYGGGSHTTGAYQAGNISPFSVYDMPNIQSKFICYSDANVIGYADLYTGATSINIIITTINIPAQHNITDVSVIGSSNSVINLDAGAYVECKYTPQSATITADSENNAFKTYGSTKMKIYGGASTGTMSMTISVAGTSQSISTEDVLFPVSWKFDIELHSGTYNLQNKLKFLTGSKLTVADGATANLSADVIFYQEYADVTNKPYVYPVKSAAVFDVNGTANISGAFGGHVDTSTLGSVLNISTSTLSVSSFECKGTGLNEKDSSTEITITETATGDIFGATENPSALTSGTFYRSVEESASNYQWSVVSNPKTYTVVYNHNYTGSPSAGSYKILMSDDSTTETVTGILAPDPVRKYWEFTGWYTDAGCTTHFTSQEVSANDTVTVYAGWKEIEYTLTYQVFNDAGESIYTNTTTFTQADIASNALTLESYSVSVANAIFLGWYPSLDSTSTITEISVANFDTYYLTETLLTVYGYETTKAIYVNYTQTIDGNAGDPYGVPLKDMSGVLGSVTLSLSDLGVEYDRDIAQQYHFIGWEVKFNNTTIADLSKFTSGGYTFTQDSECGTYTVTAKWGKKWTITVNHDSKTATSNTDAVYKFSVRDENDNIYVDSETHTKESMTAYVTPSHDYKFVIDSSYSNSGFPTDWTEATADKTCTINSSTCLVEGTLITLADGTQKAVEDLTLTDEVLVFNHVTGKVEKGTISFIDHANQTARLTEVINLKFSNNTLLRLSYSHGLFDVDLNKYVFITADNYLDFIGHNFYSINYVNGEVVEEIITLENAYLTEEVVRVFTPFTAGHSNIFADGLLTYPPDTMNINALVNIFDFDEDMKIDQEKMQLDIEKYGLYTYEELQNYVTYEQYEYLSLAYLKIAVGKGYITWDEVLIMLEYITNSIN